MKLGLDLRSNLSFGFEQTFTTPDWWSDPGFVATSNTPLKIEKMKLLGEKLAQVLGGKSVESQDIYQHVQYETFDSKGRPSFVVTMDPGSIEVKSQPLFIDKMENDMLPLFEAAELSGLVPYRNWWYGVKGGTEGGCHVNMAGLTPETNPLRADASLVIKYAAFFHNNPWIHYPFMGVDVGPGGNCMRMDEHKLDPHSKHAPGTMDSDERFARIAERINQGWSPTAEEVAAHFKGSKLAEDKHSAPSLYKFKAPLFFIEDRAVEALREARDFVLVSELRLKILEKLQAESQIPPLRDFGPALHREFLSSWALWSGFQDMAAQVGIDAEPYRRFFDRQFPRLQAGQDVPALLEVRDGRRPRVITDIKMRGELIISKTIDTSFARLELFWARPELELRIDGERVEQKVVSRDGLRGGYAVFDYRKTDTPLEFTLAEDGTGVVVEKSRFAAKDMMFKALTDGGGGS
jgi:hypothetical protein